MSYTSLHQCVQDLEKTGQLIRIKSEIDPNLEAAEIHRRIFNQKGPAILFEKIKGSPFPALSNLYGTIERTEYLFRHTLKSVQKLIELKADPARILKSPFHYGTAPFTAIKALPRKVYFSKPILFGNTQLSKLPQIVSWPDDGGAFITLPQVLSLAPGVDNIMQSNLGMYRIQISGNEYEPDREVGLHYQLHRGIGNHHTLYNESEEEFKVSIFIGGPPSHAFSAIMPMPENLAEVTFAGMLAGRRFRYFKKDGYIISADADFCITGTVKKNQKKPEGPFGDHLGYYSLAHDFPVMEINSIYHRKNAIWHFTVVGRPPQEDSSFGHLIHELVKELTPIEFPGLVELNAVDAAGVHPLLLAIGKERYMPFREKKPEEILTIANRILGTGQTSLAKYLWIADHADNPRLSTSNIEEFFGHVLERIDWKRDLHFQTNTTIDTLDYSGSDWNAGSKLVVACRGSKKRNLARIIPADFTPPKPWTKRHIVLPGIMALEGPNFTDYGSAQTEINALAKALETMDMSEIPLILICDDSKFCAASINNFVWICFTRSNPSHDIYGVHPFTDYKHWGCKGPLVIDCRLKTHHAPELIEDDSVRRKVDRLFSKSGELYRWK